MSTIFSIRQQMIDFVSLKIAVSQTFNLQTIMRQSWYYRPINF